MFEWDDDCKNFMEAMDDIAPTGADVPLWMIAALSQAMAIVSAKRRERETR